jgi:c-di-GMP-binding flagellar brake protein YcgR
MVQTLRPPRDDDPWVGFRVDDPSQVLHWLARLRDGAVPLTLNTPHAGALVSRLWTVDAAHGELSLAAEPDNLALQRLALDDEAAAVAFLDDVKLQFDLDGLMLVHGRRGTALRARLPRVVYRFQRRDAYRVRTLDRHAPRALLRHPSIPDMRLALRIVDISAGGCALHLPATVPALQPGAQLREVRIELDAETQFGATLRLQHASSLHGGQDLRLGCAFEGLDGSAQRALQRFVDRTQQRRRALA